MERVTFILHVSLAVLVMASGGIFAVAEAKAGIPALTIPVAITALILVDIYKVWRLPVWLQNGLGLLAFALGAFEFWLSDIEAPLLSAGHLLTYLTCNFLLQPKGSRQFWWLTALSLLQVAVASLLTYDSWFGLAMPVFLLVMLWTLAVFQMQQAALRDAESTITATDTVVTTEPHGWLSQSRATHATQLDEQHRWVTPRFILTTLSGTWLALLVAGTFFLLIPRVWPSTHPLLYEDGRPIGGAPARTGFTSDIQLGHIGEIQESARVALEANLFNLESDEPIDWYDWLPHSDGFPLFRGMTQEIYSDGRWQRWEGAPFARQRFRSFPRLVNGAVRQRVRIHHGSPSEAGDVVMVCGLPLRGTDIETPRRVVLELSSWGVLSVGDAEGRSPNVVDYDFEVVPWQPWFPNSAGQLGPFWQRAERVSNQYLNHCSSLPRDLYDRLENWVVQRPELLEETPTTFDLVRKWERWFTEGTELTYSLDLSVDDPSIDPVVDFLQNTRRGHCEYFASALALLLRTRGVPTRVVSGYKGGQESADSTLVVRDLHAHLWVEAYVEDAPEDPHTGQIGPRWVTLDPTPPLRDSLVATQEQEMETAWTRLKTWWTSLWSGSLRMSRSDQQALVYDPLRGSAMDLFEQVRGLGSDRGVDRIRQFLTQPRRWFSWEGGLAVFVILVLLSAVIYGVTAIRHVLRIRGEGDASDDASVSSVPFYRQLEEVLSRHGMVRATSQTPREFVANAEPVLKARLPERLQRLPRLVADRFYDIRYGDLRLSSSEVNSVNSLLTELDRELDAEALHRETRMKGARPERG